MTGSEAWSLVAPILAKYAGVTTDGKPDAMSEAYVIVFCALIDRDKRRKDVNTD